MPDNNSFLNQTKNKIKFSESSGVHIDPKTNQPLKNPYGSAQGMYQIVTKTWNGIEKQIGKKLDRRSIADNELAMDVLMSNYVKALKSKGLPINDQTLYAMHFKGDASWISKAIANPNAPTSSVFSPLEISSNKTWLQGKTLGQTFNIIGNKVGSNIQNYNVPSIDKGLSMTSNSSEIDTEDEIIDEGWAFKPRKKTTAPLPQNVEEEQIDYEEEDNNIEDEIVIEEQLGQSDNTIEDENYMFAGGGQKKKQAPIKDYRVNNQMVSDNTRNQYNLNTNQFTPEQLRLLELENNRRSAAKKQELVDRQIRIKKSIEAQKKPLSVQNLADQTQATGDKFRLFPNEHSFFDDYLNPGVMVGNMASGLGRLPLNIQEGNYSDAALSVATPLTAGAFAGIGANNTRQFLNNAFNPIAGVGDLANAGYNKVKNLKYSLPEEIKQNITTYGPSVSSKNIPVNLKDLQYAKNFAEQYGYEFPTNLDRISKSDILTDRAIRGIMDRHNTFVRGVSTNWDELRRKNPEILNHLEGKGFDLSTKEGSKQAAEYMATHVPINTGYGRASLDNNVFDRGYDAIYTSNSMPTAEGYTYGQGYITKVKKPTDFSSINREDWITKNNPEYFKDKLPLNEDFNNKILRTERKDKKLSDIQRASQAILSKNDGMEEFNKWSKNSGYRNTEFDDKISNLEKELSGMQKYDEKTGFVNKDYERIDNELYDLSLKRTAVKQEMFNNYVKNKYPNDFENIPKSTPYAHYLHIGTPGEKLLEPIKSWEITPEIWQNKSRAHKNEYTKKLSAMAYGGEKKEIKIPRTLNHLKNLITTDDIFKI